MNKIEFVEQFKVILLNRGQSYWNSRSIKRRMAGTVADPKVIFSVALKCAATHYPLPQPFFWQFET